MATNLNSACNCCETSLEVPSITSLSIVALQYRSKERSLSKCGFVNPEDGKVYFTETITAIPTEDLSEGGYFKIDVETLDISPWEGGNIQEISTATFDPDSCDEVSDCCDISNTGFRPEGGGFYDTETTYTNEYTDETLISNLDSVPFFSDFPEWTEDNQLQTIEAGLSIFDVFNGTAFQTLVETRLVHKPSISGYLKVWFWLIKRKVQQEDPDWSYEQAGTYEWSGPIPDLNAGIASSANLIYGDIVEVEASELNEGATLVVAKWSFLHGYEPSDPIFNTEDGTFARAENDCQSDGFPRTALGVGLIPRDGFAIIVDNPNCGPVA